MATSSEQRMRVIGPSFGGGCGIRLLPVSGAIDRNRCGRGRGEAAATEEAYDEGDQPPIPHRVETALLWSIRESPPIPKAGQPIPSECPNRVMNVVFTMAMSR